ncbi:MAG: hypothetical protein HY868_02375 [Chloroflexi bacterium]|nr:hypothetical protein [Chloroflexota bacterium]
MLKLDDRQDTIDGKARSTKRDDSPGDETAQIDQVALLRFAALMDQSSDAGSEAEPAWLRDSSPADQTADALPESAPAWLRGTASPDQPEESSPESAWLSGQKSDGSSDQSVVPDSEANRAGDAIAKSLRHAFEESGSVPTESSPELEPSAQTKPAPERFLNSLNQQRRPIMVGVVSALVFCCSLGWVGFVNSPLFAAAFPTATPRKVTAKAEWPATWTLTPTRTATATSTPPATATATQTPKATRVLPTRTPRPLASPTITTSPYLFTSIFRGCQHSGGTYIEGTVNSLVGEVYGARVSLGASPGGTIIQTIVTGKDKSPGYYTFVIRANGPYPGTFYVWVTDVAGKPLSDPNSGRVVTNSIKNSDDPASCWQAFIDFAATR